MLTLMNIIGGNTKQHKICFTDSSRERSLFNFFFFGGAYRNALNPTTPVLPSHLRL